MKGQHLKFLLFTVCLLFALSVHFFIKGIFLTKRVLTTKSPPNYPISFPNQTDSSTLSTPKRKLIMLLVDALREDFVEMGDAVPG